MKTFYLTLFMVFTLVVSAQDTANLKPLEPIGSDEIVGFKLYPNPVFDDVVYISTRTNAPKNIVIYDVFGEVILQDRMVTKALSISRLTPGVYVMQVTEENKTITRKLVVK